MSDEIRAVILAGGKGTRLRPYTVSLPKPLVPVGDRPILEIVLSQLKDAGVTRVTLAVNHLADLLMAYFGDGSKYGLAIDYSMETEPMGTIGPLRLIKELPENFIVMNGDVLTEFDFAEFWQAHLRSGALASVGTYRRDIHIDFGVLEVSPENRLTGFTEKPTVTHCVSMGIYAFNREILRYVPTDRPFGFDELMYKMLADGTEVRCHQFDGQWLDIGRPADYELAQEKYGTRPPTSPPATSPTK